MGKVTGIGGFFFRAKDGGTLSKWYEKHFGINAMPSTEPWIQEKGPTVFAPFKEDTDYFGSNQQFMINLRIDGIDELVETLKADGVHVDEKRYDDPTIGKFAWVYDPEGNKIELWEPAP